MHPKLLESTVQQCRDYIEAGDCHAEAPPTERLIDAVTQLAAERNNALEAAAQLVEREAAVWFKAGHIPAPSSLAAQIRALNPSLIAA